MEKITSRTNKKIQYLVSLSKEKNRQESGLFVDEGFKNMMMALQAGMIKEIYTTQSFSLDDDQVQVYQITEEILDKISVNKHSDGYVFIAKIPSFDVAKFDRVIYLDNVQDPGNVGTIIRTALAFRMDAVILSPGCASLYNSKTLAAAKGAQYQIPVFSMNMDEVINKKSPNQKIVSTTLHPHSIYLEDCPRLYSYIIVFGNEGNGVSEEIQNASDYLVKIEIGKIDSLNVAIAAGIVMHYFA